MRIEESLPQYRPKPEGALLTSWVIYRRPSDFPQGYVLRAQWAMPGGEVLADRLAWYADEPDKLRAIMPFDVVNIGRQRGDDPVILEVWI